MKIKSIHVFTMILTVMVVLFSSCKIISTRTTIHPDGSLVRSISVQGDSSSIRDTVYPLPGEEGWTVSTGRDTASDKDFIYSLERNFQTIKDLNQALKHAGEGEDKIGIEVRLQKKFRLFQTYYRYEETYRRYSPFVEVSIYDYLSPAELSIHFQHEDKKDVDIDISKTFRNGESDTRIDSATVDERFGAWEMRCMFEEFFLNLQKLAEEKGDESFSKRLDSRKMELYRSVIQEAEKQESTNESFLSACGPVLGQSTVRQYEDGILAALKSVENELEFQSKVSGDSYLNAVKMPGIIIDSNCETLEGNTASWKVSPEYFIVADYTMWAESRRVNLWAVILGAVLVIGLLCFIFLPLLRSPGRKKEN